MSAATSKDEELPGHIWFELETGPDWYEEDIKSWRRIKDGYVIQFQTACDFDDLPADIYLYDKSRFHYEGQWGEMDVIERMPLEGGIVAYTAVLKDIDAFIPKPL